MKYCLIVLLLCSTHVLARVPDITIPTKPDTVKVGCYVISLHDFNFRDKEYIARFWLWMVYKNDAFHFDDKVEIPNAKEVEKPDMILDTIGDMTWLQMKVKARMKQSWQVRDYPFDSQVLSIFVENSQFDARSCVFKADSAGQQYDHDMTVEGWKITDFRIATGTSRYETTFGDPSLKESFTEYSNFKIIITLKRDAWGLFFKLFIGMYVSVAISFVSFFISPAHVEPRFGLPVGGLFAAVGNKYVIDSFLPETSDLTLVDVLHALSFIFIFMIIAISAYTLQRYRSQSYQKARIHDVRAGMFTLACYALLNLIMVALAVY
jgi:hypothetical protein